MNYSEVLLSSSDLSVTARAPCSLVEMFILYLDGGTSPGWDYKSPQYDGGYWLLVYPTKKQTTNFFYYRFLNILCCLFCFFNWFSIVSVQCFNHAVMLFMFVLGSFQQLD